MEGMGRVASKRGGCSISGCRIVWTVLVASGVLEMMCCRRWWMSGMEEALEGASRPLAEGAEAEAGDEAEAEEDSICGSSGASVGSSCRSRR
jgi:hypothetical protein